MVDWDRFARLYDDDYGDFTADLDLYLPFAERMDGPVLEAMCGTGRVLLPLARAGHRVTGIDISRAMIELARAKLDTQPESRGRAETGDVRKLALGEQYALAIIAMNSFMHLATGADQLAALRSIRRHLQPGGMLILDLFNPDPHELVADQGLLVHAKSFRSSWDTDVQKWVLRRTDFANQMHYVEFMYDEIDPERLVRRDVLPFTMRWLYQFELQYLLQQAGYKVEGLLGSYDLDEYTSESERLIAIARNKTTR